MNVLLADDHAIVRHGIKIVIKDILPDATVFEADTFEAAIKTLSSHSISLLVLDINIPGGNNIEMIEQITSLYPGIRVLMFSGYDELLYTERCIRVGASGYLSKNASAQEIKHAIKAVASGKKYISEEVKLKTSYDLNPIKNLSNRELEVAMLLIQGSGVLEISKSLNLQTSTVSTYKNRLFEKLNISNIAELIEKFNLYKSL